MAGKRTALLVGINDYIYDNGRAKDLRGCVNDLNAMRLLLGEHYGIDEPKELKNRDASKAAIEGQLSELVRAARPDDLVVFFFAGHGSEVSIRRPERWIRKEIICPADVRSDGDWSEGYITDDHLMTIMEPAMAGVSVEIVLDCCYATGMAQPGALPRGAGGGAGGRTVRFLPPARDRRPDAGPDGKVGLGARTGCLGRRQTSGGAQCVYWGAAGPEGAVEDKIGGSMRGLFTHYFCDLVRGDPAITRAELNQRLLDKLGQQVPGLFGNAVGSEADPVFSLMRPGADVGPQVVL